MTLTDWIWTLKELKKELWKGIPMSKESEKTYRKFIKICENNVITHAPQNGSKWDRSTGLSGGTSLGEMKRELERCAERDRKSGEKCGLACQIRKHRK